ncbi:MAG: FAD-dependent oxidoreductase [Cyanobacteria bacterium P01_A01_bin.135]
MSQRIVIVGGGVVGAMLAYRLSAHAQVTLLDRQLPAQGSTGAALGVLMGAISRKTKGRAWAMRQQSMASYDALIDELQQRTEQIISYNHHGIVKLLFAEDDRDRWEALAQTRQAQGWPLALWEREELRDRCPDFALSSDRFGAVTGAVYSAGDRQVHPQQLTLALLEAARHQGAHTRFGAEVKAVGVGPSVTLASGELIEADWVVLTAGLGTSLLAAQETIDIRPVLGQAVEVLLPRSLGADGFYPAMTGHDIHIVPVDSASSEPRYWVGATVEFPKGEAEPVAIEAERQAMWAGAIALCPALEQATVVRHWWGKRPRPYNRPAPIIEALPGHDNVIVASGHYRNGVLLAPATAQKVTEMLGLG